MLPPARHCGSNHGNDRDVAGAGHDMVASHPDEQVVLANLGGVVDGISGVKIGRGAGVAHKIRGIGLLPDNAQIVGDETGAIDAEMFVHVGLDRGLRGILDLADKTAHSRASW